MTDRQAQLIEQVQQAYNNREALNIIGGNSKQFYGRAAKGQALNMAEHSGIISYSPVELVMTVKAGTKISEINAVLSENNQQLPFDPPEYNGKATMGGALACNSSGPGRPWAGSIRDAVLGIKLISGRGDLLNFGGQVMKNVAGYDVTRMMAGALGCLGVIMEISFKVVPKPPSEHTLVTDCTAADAIIEMNKLSGIAQPLSAACWMEGKLYLKYSGARSSVESVLANINNDYSMHSNELWNNLNNHHLDYFKNDEPLWRFSLKSTAAHFCEESPWIIDWAGAQRWLKGDFPHSELEDLVENHGQVHLFKGGDRSGEVFHRQPHALKQLHQRLKDSLDPNRIFNPGRLYSWL